MRHCISLSVLLFASAVALAETEVPGWGGPIANDKGIEALGWLASIGNQPGNYLQFFAAASPARPTATKGVVTVDNRANLVRNGRSIGVVSRFAVRAYTDSIPAASTGTATTPANGTATVDVFLGNLDAASNYIQNPNFGAQLSPVGVHLEACTARALASPGKPVKFVTSCGGGSNYISSYGSKVAEIPAAAVNLELRIPEDWTKPAIATVYINEQITTDIHGNPTTDKNGRYKFDPKATSGYVNIVRIVSSADSDTPGDILTLGHAAVVRDPALTDKYA
ncbi:hypothetical protein DFQ26_000854 [Actinomortierella ambigua]|nr:hypothetical protein DFQ26_000854 [Actinomortierella ambigua]